MRRWIANRHRIWWQYDVALARCGDQVQPQLLFAPWKNLLRTLGNEVDEWFFMRKAPDVRLRVLADSGAHELIERELQDWLSRGRLDSVKRVTYEPQVGLFGGALGMSLAHRQFSADSEAWLEVYPNDRLVGDDAWAAASATALLPLVVAGFESTDEAWEVWRVLARLRDLDENASNRASVGLLEGLPELQVLAQRNQEIALSAQSAARSGALSCGHRTLIANIAHFHFNRWGIRAAEDVITSMLATLDPRLTRPVATVLPPA